MIGGEVCKGVINENLIKEPKREERKEEEEYQKPHPILDIPIISSINDELLDFLSLILLFFPIIRHFFK
jgi:hypothetical protein